MPCLTRHIKITVLKKKKTGYGSETLHFKYSLQIQKQINRKNEDYIKK